MNCLTDCLAAICKTNCGLTDFPLEKAEAVVKAALHCFLNLENKVYGKALICKGA